MAKGLNGWTKWVIFAATALIALGGYMVTVRNNTKRISANETCVRTNEGDIRDLKKDIQYIKEGVDEIKRKVKK